MSAGPGPAAVAEKFRDVFLSEESGALEVQSGEKVYTIQFDRGMVSGALDGTAADGGAGAQRADVSRVVALAFSSSPDRVAFHTAPPSTGEGQADILHTVEVFLEGVRSMAGFEEVRDALVTLDRRLVLRQNPTVPLERLALMPVHGFVLSRLNGQMSFREISSTVGPQVEVEAARFLYALLLLGSVTLDPPLGHGPIQTQYLLMDRQRDFAREEAEIAFIRETYSTMQSQSLYQVLGIQEAATGEETRRAYDERRRALAPERFLDKVRERMRSELTIIEARLAESYLAIQSGGISRGTTETVESGTVDFEGMTLRREMSKTEIATNIDEADKLAESYYQKARKYFGQGDYYNCIQYCLQATRQNDQTARYHFLLGEAQSRNPDRRWQKMAEQSFLQSIKLDPWNADYLVTLGQFYKRQGFGVRARRQFERALELNPGHPKAKEELGTLK